MKEITEMATLQHAMRALCGLTRIIMPWNFSFEAIHGFLYASNFGLPELKDDPLRVPKLVKFINYVLGVNAAAWQREESFLTCGQLKHEFGVYLQCQVSGAFVPATTTSQQHNNHNKQGGKGRGGGNSFRGGGGGFRGGRDGYRRGGFQYNGGSGGGGLCKNYNIGVCKNNPNNCKLPTGAQAMHLCGVRKARGEICKEKHPAIDHK
jgi:hypothetical protein